MVPNTSSYDQLIEKWAPVLNEESAGKITDNHKSCLLYTSDAADE